MCVVVIGCRLCIVVRYYYITVGTFCVVTFVVCRSLCDVCCVVFVVWCSLCDVRWLFVCEFVMGDG